ncbi:cyclic AMP response element-binding protein A-like isoform X1 [Daphnia pulex]|uniref:cyclic AMP response element-binding protein A-like isoform X1 n=1 Tax=Daphnia pulex TaxID=6669 RepID=UPI001EDDD141|nr:cyclic AMP response element-binding protein A-like isoform X1 [Daphnia pulex]XP_046462444.1 cyclic AMP response element-binding protein A-like isoform X1 [Daphnia pulex]
MEAFDSLEQPLCDYNESMDALPELWETDSFESSMVVELQESDNYQHPDWPTGLSFSLMPVDDDSNDDLSAADTGLVVLHDRLITDASVSAANQVLANPAHRYSARVQPNTNASSLYCDTSLINCKESGSTYNITIGSRGEVEISEDPESSTALIDSEMGNQFCDPLSLSIKAEPASPGTTPASPDTFIDAHTNSKSSRSESRKRSISISNNLCNRERHTAKGKPVSGNSRLVLTRVTNASSCSSKSASFSLPPTPPSSTSSDSEGSLSPERDAASPKLEETSGDEIGTRRLNQAGRVLLTTKPLPDSFGSGSSRHPINSPLISYQPKGSTGVLQLTEEEKRTLLSEGYPVPTRLPLTKAEEKSLKKIRRKIKNKISAQESRRKKKEYMDTLERRAQVLADENSDYRQRLLKLETDNAALQLQLTRLKHLCNKRSNNMDLNSHQIDEMSAHIKEVSDCFSTRG